MRLSVVASVLLLALALPTPAGAQDQSTNLLEDGDSDREVKAGVTSYGPPPNGASVELVGLSAEEDPDAFTFLLKVADITADDGAVQRASYMIHLRHGQAEYVVAISRHSTGTDSLHASLAFIDPASGRLSYIEPVPASTDREASAFVLTVPRDLLMDSHGAAPFPGRSLDGFWVEAAMNPLLPEYEIQNGTQTGSMAIHDRMPDTGTGTAVFSVRHGIQQSGHARLESTEPFRASNGAASTFLYKINASNLAEKADTFALAAEGAPQSWSIEHPATIRIGGKDSVLLPVVVRTASTHQHGSRDTFTLTMTSQTDRGSVGRVQMGIFYPSVPQPAGHHNTLWIHSLDYSDDPSTLVSGMMSQILFGNQPLQEAFMNTLEEDERADEVPVRGRNSGPIVSDPDYPLGTRYQWPVPLDPGLLMGLDFDTTTNGTLEATVAALAPMPQARLGGQLVHLAAGGYWNSYSACSRYSMEHNDQATMLAEFAPTDMQDIGANSEGHFSTSVVPTPEADLIPYKSGSALMLCLWVDTMRPDNAFGTLGPSMEPHLLPGARVELPLLEYADPVADVFEAPDLRLEVNGSQSRLMNPGKSAVFEMTLTNEGDHSQSFRLTLAGGNRDWGGLTAGPEVRLDAGETQRFGVVVTVPPDTPDGVRADLIVEAASLEDLGIRAMRRLVVEADVDDVHPDEAELAAALQETQAKESPGPSILLLVGMLLLLRRRRESFGREPRRR